MLRFINFYVYFVNHVNSSLSLKQNFDGFIYVYNLTLRISIIFCLHYVINYFPIESLLR